MKTPANWFITLFCVFASLVSYAQHLNILNWANDQESSFYDAVEMADNSFWICGEDGLLKTYSNGIFTNVSYPNQNANLLRFYKGKEYLYVAADSGRLLTYHLITQKWNVHQFDDFKNHCFYDITETTDGDLLLCGGASKISFGKVAIPDGFVIRIRTKDYTQPEVIWSNKTQFAWTFAKGQNNQILLSAYNGIYSSIYQLENNTWQKKHRVKALVYGMTTINNSTTFYGCKSINYKKHGIYGTLDGHSKKQRYYTTQNTGFITDIFTLDNVQYAQSFNGYILPVIPENAPIPVSTEKHHFSLYRSIELSSGETFLIGHGGGIINISN